MGMMVPAVPGACSTCARAAPLPRSSTAAAHHRTFRMSSSGPRERCAAGRPLPEHAGFGVAGPVSGGRLHTTNLPWVIDESELAATLGIRSVRLVNDFHALAVGIASVEPHDLVALNEGVRDPAGPRALIG